ncbi:unnamed protein product [marine sediment metagenome]|uniref:Uncharacterized protein n=1 Tax=marine sediment metagenome TaxID=412755 RepID=X1SSX5_9ZZZZ
MLSLPEMASKGAGKLRDKGAQMATSWAAAKPRMQAGYAACPFGTARKSAYSAGIGRATYHAPDAEKWSRNWQAKMSE